MYNDCGGHSHPWKFTYIINDNVAPTGTCPSLNVTNLTCIEQVPCPDDDFSALMSALLAAGNFKDNCTANLNISLDSYSDLWQCSDDDGDGISTFGRTFYFLIEDNCGNAFPELCEVTFSGVCQPICTFTQSAWGNEGGTPGATQGITDAALIQGLLNNYGPLVAGGGNRSLTLTDAQCILTLLPGSGGASQLANCHQTNCVGCNPTDGSGRLKNSLATNLISLMLNVRYNAQYNGLTIQQVRSQSLGCIYINDCVRWCTETQCQLRITDINGTFYYYPYTLGGLIDMTNFYLGGNLSLSGGQQTLYSTKLMEALNYANDYWSDCEVLSGCGAINTVVNTTSDRQTGFEAELDVDIVNLGWFITDNSTVEKFLIERSMDALDYRLVNVTTANGLVGTQAYTATDLEPKKGVNYYRLLIFRTNGEVETLSGIVEYKVEEQVSYSLYPNPASGSVMFSLSKADDGQNVKIDMFNGLGQRVYSKGFGTATTVDEQIDLRGLKEGIYFVNITVGNKRYERKLVVGLDNK